MAKVKSRKKRTSLTIRFDPEKLAEIKHLAKLEERSANWFISEGAFQYCMARKRERLNENPPTMQRADAREGGR